MSLSSSNTRMVGQVKWFNNKAGYGFITVQSSDENANKDIFAHFSTIMVSNTQYKYLIQGEYVEFDLTTSSTDKHEFQAANITGINGGSLMCETRQVKRPPPAKAAAAVFPVDTAASAESADGFQKVSKKRSSKKKPVAATTA